MMSNYFSVPNSSDDEQKEGLLSGAEYSEKPPVHVISTKTTIVIYLLSAITVLVAFANLWAIVEAVNKVGRGIESLPRPDIFAGLPKARHSSPATHSHPHVHDGCKKPYYHFPLPANQIVIPEISGALRSSAEI